MGKIKYLIQRIKNMDFKRMNDTAKKIGKQIGRNRVGILIDIMYCGYKYLCGYVDYEAFRMYELPKNERKTFITRGINNNYVKLLNDKDEMENMKDKVYYNKMSSEFLKRDWVYLKEASFDDFKAFCDKHKEMIAKPTSEMCGKGVEKIEVDDNTNLQGLYERLKLNQPLIEECIKSNKELARFNPASLNTLRIVTIRNGNEVDIAFVGLKFGNGKAVDNFNNGGLITFVDEDGVARRPAVDKNNKVHTIHPLTKEQIVGVKVPLYDVAINLAKEAALKIDKVRYVGFDIGITDETALVIEANPFPGHDLYQSIPTVDGILIGLKPKFDEIIYRKYT